MGRFDPHPRCRLTAHDVSPYHGVELRDLLIEIPWEDAYRVTGPEIRYYRDPAAFEFRLEPHHVVILFEDITTPAVWQEHKWAFLQMIEILNKMSTEVIDLHLRLWDEACRREKYVRTRS